MRDEAAEKTDARRVAPIRACVSSSVQRYHPTQPLNATSNGGDASRVGKICSYYLVEFVTNKGWHFSREVSALIRYKLY